MFFLYNLLSPFPAIRKLNAAILGSPDPAENREQESSTKPPGAGGSKRNMSVRERRNSDGSRVLPREISKALSSGSAPMSFTADYGQQQNLVIEEGERSHHSSRASNRSIAPSVKSSFATANIQGHSTPPGQSIAELQSAIKILSQDLDRNKRKLEETQEDIKDTMREILAAQAAQQKIMAEIKEGMAARNFKPRQNQDSGEMKERLEQMSSDLDNFWRLMEMVESQKKRVMK
ncbi:hypothetical protein H0H81_004783 [Sphagnurus paluster]|uniref:Uncharacterized protein n=1 Tax=Sphagnurus paluster TaxID=117069 RepID=A0A9P7KHD1_9AGAR|nr:hypothetical protein H0H81_004783 [Sphagnurus paluster]